MVIWFAPYPLIDHVVYGWPQGLNFAFRVERKRKRNYGYFQLLKMLFRISVIILLSKHQFSFVFFFKKIFSVLSLKCSSLKKKTIPLSTISCVAYKNVCTLFFMRQQIKIPCSMCPLPAHLLRNFFTTVFYQCLSLSFAD